MFNVTHAHREIDHCVAPSFDAAPGVKAGGREDMAVQSLTAMESKYNEPPEGDNGSGAGLVSRARMPLTLNFRQKGFTLILSLAVMTSRPAGYALRRCMHGGRNKGLAPATKYTKRKAPKT